MLLIDTGCQAHGYLSGITRSDVSGRPRERQRRLWNQENAALQAVFEAATGSAWT